MPDPDPVVLARELLEAAAELVRVDLEAISVQRSNTQVVFILHVKSGTPWEVRCQPTLIVRRARKSCERIASPAPPAPAA